jgi:hypothetical protein
MADWPHLLEGCRESRLHRGAAQPYQHASTSTCQTREPVTLGEVLDTIDARVRRRFVASGAAIFTSGPPEAARSV